MLAGCKFKASALLVLILAPALAGCSGKEKASLPAKQPAIDSSSEDISSMLRDYDKSKAKTKAERPASIDACLRMAKKAIKDDDSPAAVQYASYAIEMKPDLAEGYFLRGKARFQAVLNVDKAVQDLEKAVALDPSLADGFYMLANLYSNAELRQEALSAISRAIKVSPNEEKLYQFRASLFRTLGRKNDALADLGTGIKIEPKSINLHVARAALLESYGMNEESLADYSKALELSSKDLTLRGVELLKTRAALLSKMNRHKAAIEDLSKAIAKVPEDDDALRLRGEEYTKTNNYPAALTDFTKAIDLSPQYARLSYAERSEVYKKMGNLDLADQDMKKSNSLKGERAEKPIFESHQQVQQADEFPAR